MVTFVSVAFRQFCPSAAIFLLGKIVLAVLLLLLLPSDGSPVLPGPPIFEAISHYPSLCYLPPESGMCPPSANGTTDKRNDKPTAVNASRVAVDDGVVVDGDRDVASQLRHATPLLTRFFFDAVTAQCYPFGAQTCGGNENRFETQAQCLAKCRIGNE